MVENCGHKGKCGCEDQGFLTPPLCGDQSDCPNPDPCSETFSQQCLVYTEENDLVCNGTVIATNGDRLPLILQRLVSLLCNNEGVTFGVTQPLPNQPITQTTTTLIIGRTYYSGYVIFTPENAPSTLRFNYDDNVGNSLVNQTTIIIEPGRSAIEFTMTGLNPGSYQFNLIASAGSVNVSIPVNITI